MAYCYDDKDKSLKVIFTDWNTVMIKNNEESVKEYLDSLEEKIKTYEIKNFKYKPENDSFSYYMNDKKYTIHIKKNTYVNRILFSLMQLSNEICKKKEYEEKIKKEKQENINKIEQNIESGKIETEEEKENYLKSLKKSLSIKNIINKCVNKFKKRYSKLLNDTNDVRNDFGIYYFVMSIISALGLGSVILICAFDFATIPIIYKQILSAVFFTSAVGGFNFTVQGKFDPISIISSLTMFSIDIIKESFGKEASLARHKIKVLENTLKPIELKETEEEKENKSVSNNINNELNKIYESISVLDRTNRKKFYLELSNLISNYRRESSNIPKGLTLENQHTVNMEFIRKLNEFSVELEMFINKNKKFDVEEKIEQELNVDVQELKSSGKVKLKRL